jgi:hypothetical protein
LQTCQSHLITEESTNLWGLPMQSVLSIVAKKKHEVPEHELSAGHMLLLAMRERGGRPRLRDARELKPSGVIACENVRELIYDVTCLDGYAEGDEFDYGWIANVQRALGLKYTTCWNIARGEITSISSRTVDMIAAKSGVPAEKFYVAKKAY